MKRTTGYIIIGVATIITGWLLSRAWIQSHQSNVASISVTGRAQRDFTADLIVWSGSFSRKSMSLQDAYASLKRDAESIRAYLAGKGVPANELVFSAIEINKEYDYVKRDNYSNAPEIRVFTGYNLVQNVTVESKSVDKIETVSREVTALIDAGIELNSRSPEYYYTQLADLKIKMLAEASKDATTRAESIAENAGSKVGDLRKAQMGIFQITAQNSPEEYSWGGTFNTASKRKTASITVNLSFEID